MFFNFDIGDFIFHPNYGVGKLVSLELMNINNTKFEFLKIEYQDNAFIFIPSYNIKILKFHSYKDSNTKIESLGKSAVLKKQSNLKNEISKVADELIKIAAIRESTTVDSLSINSLYTDFSTQSPFDLTKDQSSVIKEVESDLVKTKPMDRLLCADVGFGKTEVAIRGMALSAFNDKKSLFIVPTTILALQHYKSIKERFSVFGKKCAMLSTLSENKYFTKKEWKAGNIDILITTASHRGIDSLLIDNIGLVVLDEEHHFGVKFKEKIRQKSHCLQLSATPIPRTLNLALSKVKSISTLESPPIDKKNTSVFIKNLSEIDLEDIIKKEINKGGKVFLVVPRVEFIKSIEKLVSFTSYSVLHGQLSRNNLEKNLSKFMNEVNVLISTNIIESGMNILEANLMIIFESHMFGVAQLHQLKGRVGRGGLHSSVYFIVPKSLKSVSYDRLKIVHDNSNVGDGFNLSIKDMEHRGSGTAVANKQSGKDYGFGMEVYFDMLSQAMGEVAVQNSVKDIILVGVGEAYIPDDYIEDSKVKITFYKKLGAAKTLEGLNEVINDLMEMGSSSKELDTFIDIVKISLIANYLSLKKIEKKNGLYNIYIEPSSDDLKLFAKSNISNSSFMNLKIENIDFLIKKIENIF